jgi:hypothetical protein
MVLSGVGAMELQQPFVTTAELMFSLGLNQMIA